MAHTKYRRKITAATIAAVLFAGWFGTALSGSAANPYIEVLNDGSRMGWVNIDGAAHINVSGQSPDGNCFSFGIPLAGVEAMAWLGLPQPAKPAGDIHSLGFWVKSPPGAGVYWMNEYWLGLRYADDSTGTYYDFSGAEYRLLNAKTSEISQHTVQTSGEGYGTFQIPTDFEGYVFLDLNTTAAWDRAETWAKHMALSNLRLGMYGFANQTGTVLYLDELSVSAMSAGDYADYVHEDLQALPDAPQSSVTRTYVPEGTGVVLSAQAGAEIRYTLDDTKPTGASALFDPAHPILINQKTKIRAIARKDGKTSPEAAFLYIPETHEEATVVLNDGTFTGDAYHLEAAAGVPGLSPDGRSISFTGKDAGADNQLSFGLTGAAFPIKEMKTLSFWIRTPAAAAMGNYFWLGLRSTGGNLKGADCLLWNIKDDSVTSDGILYGDPGDMLRIPAGFEGYVILDLTTAAGWSAVCDTLSSLQLYFWGYGQLVNHTLHLDNLTVSALEPEAMRQKYEDMLAGAPAAPAASPASGVVADGTRVTLTAAPGTVIYYTADGSAPTDESPVFDPGNPIALTGDTVIKAIAVKNGLQSAAAVFSYILESSPAATAVINDGSRIGWTAINAKANVKDVSPDGNAISLIGGAAGNNMVWLDLAQPSAPAKNMKTLSYWVKVPDNNFGLWDTFWMSLEFLDDRGIGFRSFRNAAYYLVDSRTGDVTSHTVAAAGDQIDAAVFPVGFEGYVIFDLETAAQWPDMCEKLSAMALRIWGYETFRDRTIYADNFTLSLLSPQKLAERLKAQSFPSLPASSVPAGEVGKGTPVALSGPAGAQIRYTVNGSAPGPDSALYDSGAPIVIQANTAVRAVAVKDGKMSGEMKWTYIIKDSYTGGNQLTANDGSGEGANRLKHLNLKNQLAISEVFSPHGKAFEITPQDSSGLFYGEFALNADPDGYLLAKDSLGFWIKIGSEASMDLLFGLNDETNLYKGDITTYDATTGQVQTYQNRELLTLGGFEGYVILDLKNATVTPRGGAGTGVNIRTFLNRHGLGGLVVKSAINGLKESPVYFDHFTVAANAGTYLQELKALPLRPKAPEASIKSGEVEPGTAIDLTSSPQADIYYTMDGSEPDENSEKYVTINMGNGLGNVSPIKILKDTVLKAVAVLDGRKSAVVAYTYTVIPPYDGPNVSVINDGSGAGANTFSWCDPQSFTPGFAENVSPGGRALSITGVANHDTVAYIGFNADLTGVEQIGRKQAFSLWVKVPDLGPGNSVDLVPKFNGESFGFMGVIYALGSDGSFQKFTNSVRLNNFEGILLIDISGSGAVYRYANDTTSSWYDFVRGNPLSSFGLYVSRNIRNQTVVFDSLSLVHDQTAYLKELGFQGLIKSYDSGHVENIHMIVMNDGGGTEKNNGLYDIQGNPTVKPSDVSPDDACVAVTLSGENAVLAFQNYSKDEDIIMGDGFAFWIKNPGSRAIPLNIRVNEAGEEYYYTPRGNYYLIDKSKTASRHTGALIIPKNFEGWVVIPRLSLHLDQKSAVNNTELDFPAITALSVEIVNENQALKGYTVYLDDISAYVDFSLLVKAHAYRWSGMPGSPGAQGPDGGAQGPDGGQNVETGEKLPYAALAGGMTLLTVSAFLFRKRKLRG